MKVISDGAHELCEIGLRLNSTDRRYHWTIQGAFKPVSDMLEEGKTGWAEIVFNDSREIDQLIDMLLRFKDDNVRCFGVWR